MKRVKTMQIPPGETCADRAHYTDPAWRTCADHADRTDPIEANVYRLVQA